MKIEEIIIEDGLYNSKLFNYLWRKKLDASFNKQVLEILQKLCKGNLLKKESIDIDLSFTDDEKEILINTDIIAVCKNKEIIARWCDYVQDFDKNKRPTYIKKSCANYLEVFNATKHYEYLVRKLQLINKAKGLFITDLEDYMNLLKT